jgi:hypothetical protein
MLKIKKLLRVFVFFAFLNNLQARDWFSSKKDVDAPLPAELNEKDRSDLVCDHIIEDFSTSEVGSFPKDWQPKYEKHLKPIKEAKLWVVEHDSTLNQNVLKGTYATETMTIVKKISDWNLDLYPYFEWDWKAEVLPTMANEFDSKKNDSAASVYLAWKLEYSFIPAKTLRFAWSSTQKVNATLRRMQGYDNIVIMESGSEHLHQWRHVRVDLKAMIPNLVKLKGKESVPYALALTTDADQTKSSSQAYYANFKACRLKEKPESQKNL